MKYSDFKTTKPKSTTRVGRGISAGKGKTAGRGTKGQGARKSGGTRPGFEGGQMPLYMRLPKLRGFKSKATKPENVYTGQLEAIKGSLVDNFTLYDLKLVSSPYVKVKLILSGVNLTSKKEVKLQAASSSAIEAIKKAGGSFTATDQVARQQTTDKNTK